MAKERTSSGRPKTGRENSSPARPAGPAVPPRQDPVETPPESGSLPEDFKFLSSFLPEGESGEAEDARADVPASFQEPEAPPSPESPSPDPSPGPDEFAFPPEEALHASAAVAVEEEGSDLLCFQVAEEEYAIDIRRVWEIIRPRDVTEIPRVAEFISGIISLRGEIVPVLDLRRRLGFPPAESVYPTAKIVVAIHDGRRVGMAVDAVAHKIRVREGQVTPPTALPGASESGYLTGVCRHEGRLIAILNADTVLGFQIGAADADANDRRGAKGAPGKPLGAAGGAP